MFAYNAQVGCDKHGWALAYSIDAGNVHDSQAFLALFEQLERLQSGLPYRRLWLQDSKYCKIPP